MKKVALILVGVLLGAGLIHAQTSPDLNTLVVAKVPLVPGPLLTPAPAHAQWTVTSSTVPGIPSPVGGTPQPSAPVIQTVNKSDHVYQVQTPVPGGLLVRWNNQFMQATYLPGVSAPQIDINTGKLNFINFSKTDYPDFAWITERNYVGVAQLGTGKALIFKGKVKMLFGGALPVPLLTLPHSADGKENAIAAVDFLTRKPLMVQVSNELLTYQFTNQAPNLTLPKDVQNAFALMQKGIQQSRIVPSG
jgi:hypothetical protein